MSYRTILVHVDQSSHAAARIKVAAEIAIAENAHLIGTAMTGISRFIYQDSVVDLRQTVLATHLDYLSERANKALAQFDDIARQMGVLSYEKRLVDDEPEGGLVLQARYCDLVVVSQADPDEPTSSVIADLPEYVMLNCARPVLIVPYAGRFDQVGSNVLVAWDGSMEATRAVTNAIPALKRAKNVTIALFNPAAQFDVHGEQPGADIALLSLAADMRADLIVMGGYGHTRFREVLLGGVTMTVLNTMTAPVLMSH